MVRLQPHFQAADTDPAPWYRNAVIYEVDVKSFQDSNADGIGDLPGLLSRLEYVADLGVNLLWLQPLFASPKGDNGYDVSDYRRIDPALGSLDDFREVVDRAGRLGMRVLLDLPLNHTSRDHAWFRAAQADRRSPYRPYYLWSDEKPADAAPYPVFGSARGDNWTWSEEAGQYYFHTFYDFMPDVNVAHGPLREELLDVLRFWLRQGVQGFRLDALPFLLKDRAQGEHLGAPHDFLKAMRRVVAEHVPDGVLLAEVNKPLAETVRYFGQGDEVNLMLNFSLCSHMFLALATGEARHIQDWWRALPPVPPAANWANFVRNHDELALAELTAEEQAQVYRAFGPRKEHRGANGGIRRRLAPMVNGDVRRMKLMYSLMCSLPGAVIVNLGEEIGLGEDLSLWDREAARTPMQWTPGRNGGFSAARRTHLYRPVVNRGRFRAGVVNVQAQQDDPDSLLHFVRRALHVCRDTPALAGGDWAFLDAGHPGVLAQLSQDGTNGQSVLALHNLTEQTLTVHLPDVAGRRALLGSGHAVQGSDLTLDPYGSVWLGDEEDHA